jgi:hypothetical protein
MHSTFAAAVCCFRKKMWRLTRSVDVG